MNFKEAYSWLNQPGIKAAMPVDRHTKDAIGKAMEALEKQIAKPYVVGINERGIKNYSCPCCEMELGDKDWDGEPDEEWLGFCDNCGQKIQWVKNKNEV